MYQMSSAKVEAGENLNKKRKKRSVNKRFVEKNQNKETFRSIYLRNVKFHTFKDRLNLKNKKKRNINIRFIEKIKLKQHFEIYTFRNVEFHTSKNR